MNTFRACAVPSVWRISCRPGVPTTPTQIWMFRAASVGRAGPVSGAQNRNSGVARLGCDVGNSLIQLRGGGDGLKAGAVAAARCGSTAVCVLVTGLVRWAALLVSQARTAVIQRGAGIPG